VKRGTWSSSEGRRKTEEKAKVKLKGGGKTRK